MTNKIATLALSPSLDLSSETEKLYPMNKIRCKTPTFEPGGGGINVARVITRLGGQCAAIYPSGGATGKNLTELLTREHVNVLPVDCKAWTRQNLNVSTYCDSQQYRFVMPGSRILPEELDAIESLVMAEMPDYLVISGSLPEGVESNTILELIQVWKQKGIKIIFDCSGKPLLDVVNTGGLFLIKPNAKELGSLSGTTFKRVGDLEKEAIELVESRKSEIALISLGAQGALLVTQSSCEQIVPPKVITKSTVGAGDSMVAATVYALSLGHPIKYAAMMGVAAGTATTMRSGTALCDRTDVEHIFQALCNRYNV